MTTRTRLLGLLAATAATAPLALTPAGASAAHTAPQPARTGVIQAIDAGALEPSPGWSADDGHTGGEPSDGPAPAAGSAPAVVQRTSRWGDRFSYTLRRLTPGTTYTVRLHFVDSWSNGPGQRVFDVSVNGAVALGRMDVFAAAGSWAMPVARDVRATADAQGRIRLDFTGVSGSATVSGIEVLGQLPPQRFAGYPQVSGIVARPSGPTSTYLTWRVQPGVRQYAVLRDGREVGRTALDSFVDTTAVPGRSHRYTVAAVDPDGTLGQVARPRRVTMPTRSLHATGAFHTEGRYIVDPAGKPFVPVGANIGTRGSFDWAGSPLGHSREAKEWGWNTVRIAVEMNGWDHDALRALVAEYRAAGLVVIIDAHSYWWPWDPQAQQKTDQVRAFWRAVVPDHAHDSGVWFNVANEPGYINDAWTDFNDDLVRIVRGLGARNIVVVDAPVWGQDLGSVTPLHEGARYGYDPSMAPTLAHRYGDVVLAQHNYGGQWRYRTPETYGAYVDRVHATGLPLLSSEFGYSMNGETTAGSYAENRDGAKAAFAVNPVKGVGSLPWHATSADIYSLKQDRSAFWTSAPRSELGEDLWRLTH